MIQGGDPSIPIMQGGNSPIPMAPPPSSLVTFLDRSRLAEYHLPSHVPFQMIVQAYHMPIPGTIIDEGDSLSIMSSTAWKALGSSQPVPIT